jgi:alpha-tubulin suppressor-like RCC1 family protein
MVTCWGDNSAGTLGTQTPSLESPTPVMVQGIAGATAIAAGGGHVCALVGDKAWCWGYLLDGTSSSSPVPRAVSGVEGVTSLAAGVEHVCAVVGTGAVVCWGRNIDGELGTTTAGPYSGPVTVTGWP